MTATSESLQIAAQCWCDPRTSATVMDPVLAEVFAEMLDRHNESAAQFFRNAEFYHGIVTQIGEMLGVVARTSDDGAVQNEVLALKVPELVASLKDDLADAKRLLTASVHIEDEYEKLRRAADAIWNKVFQLSSGIDRTTGQNMIWACDMHGAVIVGPFDTAADAALAGLTELEKEPK